MRRRTGEPGARLSDLTTSGDAYRGARHLASLLLAGLISAIAFLPAQAGDIAAIEPIGFSADGKVFAFEQYGIQDGSGFPYSEILFIDTVADTYLPGIPIRSRIDDEGATISAVRAESRRKAEALITVHRPADHPGQFVAFNPVSELDTDPHRIAYRAYPAEPAFGGAYRLQLEEIDAPLPEKCEGLVEAIKGFRLDLTERDGTAVTQTLHRDETVPASRNCPTGYRIGGAVTYRPLSGETVHIALVMVMSFGFEGRDGRWIAVPFHP